MSSACIYGGGQWCDSLGAVVSGGRITRAYQRAVRRLPILGQDGDQPPAGGTDRQRAVAAGQRDAPAVLPEMLSPAAPDLPQQMRVFAELHRAAEDGVEPAVEVPGFLPELPAEREVVGLSGWLRLQLRRG